MKSPSSSNRPRKLTLAEAEAMAKRDRTRIILLAVAAFLLAGGYFGAQLMGDKYEDQDLEQAPQVAEEEEAPIEEVVTLPFTDADGVLEAIADATPEERLSLSDDALTALLYYAMTLVERNYESLGVADLDAATIASIQADPLAHRVAPYRARGRVSNLGKRRRDANLEEHYGTLELADGSFVHIAFVAPPDEPIELGDYLRIDGLFAQLYRTEVDGQMRDAPLIAGRHVELSMPECTALDASDLRAELIRGVDDDQLDQITGVSDDALWQLMAFAHERSGEVDWENDAVELNSEMLNSLMQDGEAFRGVPFRVPISGNMGTWTERAGENCLRLDRVTTGWIGNFTWKGATGVIKFIAPFDRPDLKDRKGDARLVTANGFFLKNVFYKQGNDNPGRAPLFVMSGVEIFTPDPDMTAQYLLWGVLGGTLFIVGLIYFLLRRDKKQAAALQDELVRRRRARRAAKAEASPLGS